MAPSASAPAPVPSTPRPLLRGGAIDPASASPRRCPRADRRELRRQLRAVVRARRADRERRVTAGLSALAAPSTCEDLYLGRVEPRFGSFGSFESCWYQLAFVSAERPGPTVRGRVTRYESKTVVVSWVPGSRWQLRRRERHYGRGAASWSTAGPRSPRCARPGARRDATGRWLGLGRHGHSTGCSRID